jgi:ABC-2 type transport system permease protein
MTGAARVAAGTRPGGPYSRGSVGLTFVGRSLRHSLRSLDSLLTSLMLPVSILLMFVYVFGGAIQSDGRYVDYVVPGIIVLCAGFGSAGVAVAVALDMTNGVIDRFRTLPISAGSVLTGHVVANVARNIVSTTLVIGVALICGFRPVADPLRWLAAAGLLLALMIAISWIATSFGLLVKSVETANALTFVAAFAPYLSSAFVPPETMPAALQWVAENQPVTPIVDTLRDLTMGGHVGSEAFVALAWCVFGALVGRVCAGLLFRRR